MQKKYSRRTFLAASAAAALLLTGCSGSPEDPAPSIPDSATPSPEPEPDDSIEKPADSNTETIKDIVWIIQPNNDGSGTAYITGYEKSGPQPRGQVIIPDTTVIPLPASERRSSARTKISRWSHFPKQ